MKSIATFPAICVLAMLLANFAALAGGCGGKLRESKSPMTADETPPTPLPPTQLATFGAGCFWCVEAVFQELEGVLSVTSGYTGGQIENPTYEAVCSGVTGHAEVIQIRFDPARITYEQLLEVFFKSHDPTTLNRQGADVGTQYRSAVFAHDEEQRAVAERIREALDGSGAYSAPLVTEVVDLERFYEAEDDHQDYYGRNATEPYCRAVIAPKLDKFRKVFGDRLKRAK